MFRFADKLTVTQHLKDTSQDSGIPTNGRLGETQMHWDRLLRGYTKSEPGAVL